MTYCGIGQVEQKSVLLRRYAAYKTRRLLSGSLIIKYGIIVTT